MFKRMLLVTILLVSIVALLGCNTVQGIGEDIQGVGEKSEEVLTGQ